MKARSKVLALLAGVLLTATAQAGPDDGVFGPACRDCPRGNYSPLHYWAPAWYEARAHFHRYSLDQYPPGPSPSVPSSYQYSKYRCPSIPPTPTSPYADPDAYYGRPVAPR